MSELLRVSDACVEFRAHGSSVKALNGVSLSVSAGECVAVVGESGSGKTTLARSILGLQKLDSGTVEWLADTPGKTLAQRIGMVWQDPYASLDPRWKVGRSIQEPCQIAKLPCDLPALMQQVGLDPTFADRYPHQMSGGQRQRVAIARALALRPPLVVCDEPTSALDLSVQAQVLNLLQDLQQELGCSYIYVSHSLSTVRYIAQRVLVMWKGSIVEQGSAEQVFEHPEHEYTRSLIHSSPKIPILVGD